MTILGVAGTTVVGIPLDALFRLLFLDLPADWATTMAALDEFPSVEHLVGAIDLLAQQDLNSIPSIPADQGLVLAWIPLPLILHLTDVAAIPKVFVEAAWAEPWLGRRVEDAFLEQPLA